MIPSSIFGNKVIRLEETDSTNRFLSNLNMESDVEEGTAVVSNYQTAGRGQKGTVWESEKGKNLMVSFQLRPSFLMTADQFYISKIVALSVCKTIAKYVENVQIKWPNDILVSERKIAGILIENSLQGQRISSSIAGIGININQTEIDDQFYATSLKQITKTDTQIEEVFEELCRHLNHYYSILKMGKLLQIDTEYFEHLFKYKLKSNYVLRGKEITATITGVHKNGFLELLDEAGNVEKAELKEIIFVRES